MSHNHRNHEHVQPNQGYVGHYEHEKQLEKNLPDPDPYSKQGGRGQHTGHDQHSSHNKHAGHSPDIFKRRFFICLLLTLPVLYFSPMFQDWFSYQAVQFPGQGKRILLN